VINHSWYIDGFINCADAVYSAIENTEALGIVNIISAGNSGALAETIQNPADRALDVLDCFAVGNLNHDTELINSTSSRGPSPCDPTKIKPQVVAPGTSIRSAWSDGSYNTMTGTSQAAPHVSGLVLLMRQKNPNATVDEIKSAPILNGIRGQSPVDKNRITDLLLTVSDLIESYPQIQEMDLNPVLVYEKGISVVDARIILKS